MREKFHKFIDAYKYKATPVGGEWPIAMVVLGVAITPVWAGVLLWFLFHFLTRQWLLLP